MQPSEVVFIQFLSELANKRLSYSTINSYKAAISETISSWGDTILSNNSIVSRFMRGIFLSNPPKPKYSSTWNVNEVLSYLQTLYPLEDLSLMDLTLKVTALIALTTAQRVQTLVSLNLDFMSDFGEYIEFSIQELMKTTRPGQKIQKVRINAFTNKELCVLHTMRYYISKTEGKRKTQTLLVSFKTFKAISTSTVARWMKIVLDRSGIDSTIFTAHSYRGASSSAAYASGVQLSEIMKVANWANAKTFYKYYHRESVNSYANHVLSLI